MKSIIIVLSVLLAIAAAGPPASGPIPIVRQTSEINPDGTHNFLYETADGVYHDQQGYPKTGDILAVQGQYQYVGEDGKVYKVSYVADENGFQPLGDHLPTAPPVPQAVQSTLNKATQLPGKRPNF